MKRRRKPIYVESLIRCPMDELWAKTQQPELHQRWDLRFGEITYLPKSDDEPQSFIYATTVFPGMRIAGMGESLGDKNRPDGTRWSGLKFWANDRRSPIEAGAGYWRYIPTDDGIRFLTRYDYRPRWGLFGELIDKFAFRPAFGWATAWSFDRLRLWLENGIEPEQSRNQAIVHASAVAALASVWTFQGLVPKILKPDPTEVDLAQRCGLERNTAILVVKSMGLLEAGLGLWMARSSKKQSPFVVNLIAIPLLTAAAWKADRQAFAKAFNPTSINAALMALGTIALATRNDLPSGLKPLRTAPDAQPSVQNLPGDRR